MAAMTQRRGNYSIFFVYESTVMAASMAACMACFERIVDEYLATECNVPLNGASDASADAGKLRSQSFEACCRFQRAFEFAERMDVGLRLVEPGEYSVQFELALFPANDEDVRCKPLATGSVVRVFIARDNNKPVPISGDLRSRLLRLQN